MYCKKRSEKLCRLFVVGQIVQAGASDYLPKSSSVKEFLKAIHSVMRNHTYISPKIMDSMVEYIQEEPVPKKISSNTLTPREQEVLELIASGKTTKEISAILYISEKTVESHRYQIMQKLGVHNLAELIKIAIQKGVDEEKNDDKYA